MLWWTAINLEESAISWRAYAKIGSVRCDARYAPSEANFFRVKPARFWFDFAYSVVIAYTAAIIYNTSPLLSWPQLIAFPIAVFWLYRVESLVHEVAHLQQAEMRTFKVVWNLVVGVFTLTPSAFYTKQHRDHHSQRMYGTRQDPEYVINVVRRGSWASLLAYALLILVFPVLVFLRFLLVPLTYLHPRLRQFALTRASSFTFNPQYRRKLSALDRRAIAAIEWPCFLRAALIPGGALLGFAPWIRVPQVYLLGVSVLILNQLRQVADHHFSGDGGQFVFADHVLDSCNYKARDPLTWLFFPFAIQYHALHHIFPNLPYHNLAAADAYLLAKLPADSPYRTLDQPGWWSVAQKLSPHRFSEPQRSRPARAIKRTRITC